MGTVLCIAALDTKGPDIQYLKQQIEKREHTALVLDIGSLGEPYFTADITSAEVAKAAGSNIEEVKALKYASQSSKVMTAGALSIVMELYSSGKFDGIIAIGGGMGCAIATAIMRELPVGFPKFMLATQKIVQAGIMKYVGTSDIVMMPSVADIAGLNRLTMTSLSKAAGAIVGMIESPDVEILEKPLVFVTILGTTAGCVIKCRPWLEDKGFEVVGFDAIGVGGMTFESLVGNYPVKGVIELSLNEIGNELLGGLASAGPGRLEAAGRKGIPQIITPGNVDFISFLGPETVSERYQNRNLHFHNPQATVVRLNAEELSRVAEAIAGKLNLATGPVKVLIPSRGFSSWDFEGGIFYDPVANRSFVNSLKNSLNRAIEVKEVNAHINDLDFARAVFDEFMGLMRFI